MDFLRIREEYKIAYHRWENCANELCTIFHCDFANLEMALLGARGNHRHMALIQEYARLGIALDAAADRWDTAQLLQSRLTAATQQVNHDLKTIEC